MAPIQKNHHALRVGAVAFLLLAGQANAQSIFSPDLAGTERRSPATMGALEVAIGEPPGAPAIKIANDIGIYLAWRAHPDKTVTGYFVYYGTTLAGATKFVSDLVVSSSREASVLAVRFDLRADLDAGAGSDVCFKIKAYNGDGLSPASPGVCKRIPSS